jgi:hypothetical protein
MNTTLPGPWVIAALSTRHSPSHRKAKQPAPQSHPVTRANAYPLIRDTLQRTVPEFTVPRRIRHADQLPLNPNRKTDREVLTVMAQSFGRCRVAPAVQPSNQIGLIW